MTVDNGVRIIAGSMVLLSLLLTTYVHTNFVWLTVFVGVNLIQSAFTGFCPAALFLKNLALNDDVAAIAMQTHCYCVPSK